jgi:hypothetical protein
LHGVSSFDEVIGAAFCPSGNPVFPDIVQTDHGQDDAGQAGKNQVDAKGPARNIIFRVHPVSGCLARFDCSSVSRMVAGDRNDHMVFTEFYVLLTAWLQSVQFLSFT